VNLTKKGVNLKFSKKYLPIILLILPVQHDMNQWWETPVTFWNKPSENLLPPDQRGA
jgi:hypothetical protein